MLDAGCDDRGLGSEKRDCLALHVRAHEGSVTVVVLKERDHGGSDGDHHARGNIDVVNAALIDLDDLVAVAADDSLAYEAAVLIERLGRLRDYEAILLVGGEVINLIGDAAGRLVYLLIRRDKESVLIDLSVGSEVGNKSDVRAFRSLDRAHTAVMAVMNVADVEGRSLTAQTAGAERGKAALMGKLCEGVRLIHELAQRARAEKLLDRGGHGADIYKALRSYDVEILKRHSLADNSLHSGEADAELVLEQLAD